VPARSAASHVSLIVLGAVVRPPPSQTAMEQDSNASRTKAIAEHFTDPHSEFDTGDLDPFQ